MRLFKFLAVLLILAIVATPVAAQAPTPPFDGLKSKGELPLKELPEEIQAYFRDGLTVDDFLRNYRGPIPKALWPYTSMPITVVVELDGDPLVTRLQAIAADGEDLADVQKRHPELLSQIAFEQDMVLGRMTQTNASLARVINDSQFQRYSLVLNGYRMNVPANQVSSLEGLAGVRRVSVAKEFYPSLTNSVPMIKADQVWSMVDGVTGYTGKDVTVAVIDTGIDYTHMMFGTTGNPALYKNNNPDVIEPGSFPTYKVVGGYDLAGTNYNASDRVNTANQTPIPDPDPLDQGGHGTHVASTIAGLNAGWGTGVAPDVKLVAIKIFGRSGSTNLVIDGVERALDPNGDGFINDKVDIANLSVGAPWGLGDVDDPEYQAVENAIAAGVFMAISAGNESNNSYITGSPSVSDSAISVAASSTGFTALPWIRFNGDTEKVHYMPTDNALDTRLGGELVWAGGVSSSATFCGANGVTLTSPDAVAGKILLLQRGGCNFTEKLANAEAVGAAFALVYNNVPGAYVNMAVGESTIPSGFTTLQAGMYLSGLAPLTVMIGTAADAEVTTSGVAADTIGDFSSRGPRGYDSKLKPEVTAPGVGIFAASVGTGNKGVAMSGTSMAAPHIAGVAALIKEAHPNWTTEQIKAALMNTAVDLLPSNPDKQYEDITRQGAGRVDALAAVSTDVVAVGDPKLVSLSWGLIELGPQHAAPTPYTANKQVSLRNFGTSDVTYNVSIAFTSAYPGATLTPAASTITVPANGGKASVSVTFMLDAALVEYKYFAEVHLPNEYTGFVIFDDGAGSILRVPFLAVARPHTVLTELPDAMTTVQPGTIGYVDLSQTTPSTASNLNTATVYMESQNDPYFKDAAEVRYVGFDFAQNTAQLGPITAVTFSQWGPIHDPQPYFAEIDLLVDMDKDGKEDYAFFNFNAADLGLSTQANFWSVAVVETATGKLGLGSPYDIITDFNSGLQVWYIPFEYFGMEGTADFTVACFDRNIYDKVVGEKRLDPNLPALIHQMTDWYPQNSDTSLLFMANDLAAYIINRPLGVMVTDIYGKPGLGQAKFWPVEVQGIPTQFLPIIAN